MTEFGFINSIKTLCADLHKNGFEGIGDDCAVFEFSERESLLFTTDLLCEGVHFLRHATSARELGGKALAVNLSDIAAMGARPVATLLSLSLPAEATEEWAAEFMEGYHALSKRYGVALIGGDTTRSQRDIVISVTAIGRAANDHIKRRSEAETRDVIFTTAPLGGSDAGLRDILDGRIDTPLADLHRNPCPEIEKGQWLGARHEVHAMMDISDGIASDLRHIMTASHKGAVIDLDRVPVTEGATLKQALCGGEEYRLLFTASFEAAEQLARDFERRFRTPLYPIGRITEGAQLKWREHGTEVELDWKGFTHY